MLDLHYFIYVGLILFFIGTVGVIARRNLFTIFMSIELMLNAVNLIFAAFALANGTMDGHSIAMMVMAMAAAEAAFGLAIVIVLYRNKQSLNIDLFKNIKG